MNRLLPTRRLIPRWRKARFSVHQPDMLGLVTPTALIVSLNTSERDVEQALHSWKATGSIGDLADLLAFGVDSKQRNVLADAARTAVAMQEVTPAMRLVAQEVLRAGTSQDEVWRNSPSATDVRGLRALLKNAPDDVIALVDLAQHHLAHGKQKAAYRALAAAHQISPNSVYVIRALTRYWIHVGEEDRAHAFIKGSGRISTDPWLMATEIATAQVANASSTQLRRAQRALSMGTFRSQDVSELAGAVAGTELSHGNLKDARKLFRLALQHPNDNVLAQAITNQEFLEIDIDDQMMRRAPNGVFEGQALRAMLHADFEAAANFTKCWGEEEPFSSRPRTLESFIHGALGNFELALEAADKGLISDPEDVSLRGNRAYALAALGRLDEAGVEIALLERRADDNQHPFMLATKGMVMLLRGQKQQGLQFYEEALGEFKRKKQESQYTDCLAFMARTLTVANAEDSDDAVAKATERYAKSPSQAAAVILRGLNEIVKTVDTTPLRKVVQWEWNPAANTITERRRLTRKGAPGFVVTPSKANDIR